MSAAEQLAETYAKNHPLLITEGITHRQMALILKDAAKQAELAVAAATGNNPSAIITRLQQRQIAAQLQAVSTQVWKGTGRIVQAGIYQQGFLAADQAIDLAVLNGLPGFAAVQLAQPLRFEAAQAVEDIISRKTEGFTLAERIYANGKVSTRQVGAIVDRALARQLSARELAKQVKEFYRPDVPGGTSYAAMRLARTEINNAHHTTTVRLAQKMPWVHGFKWNLSGSHSKPDECNEYAAHEEGLGEGVFPKDNVPAKPHPQCLCYLTHIMDEDDVLVGKVISGEYDEYLADLGVRCPS